MFGILGDGIGSYNMVDELDYENMQLKFFTSWSTPPLWLINWPMATSLSQIRHFTKAFTHFTNIQELFH